MKIGLVLATFLSWGSFLPVPAGAWLFQHGNQFYLPLSRVELSRRFPVKYLGTIGGDRLPGYFEPRQDRPLPNRLEAGPAGAIVAQAGSGGLLITGNDKRGYPWSVDLGDLILTYACRFYSADLDHNGIRDLALIYPTGGNGLAPTSHIFVLTFDDEGRPVPFHADGYFQDFAKEGIFDLVDLNWDGRAELIYMNFDDGYWITNLYEVRGARWRRVKGVYGEHSYPLYTRFTHRPNRKAVVPSRGRQPFAPDLSNGEPYLKGQLISYRWANVASSEDIELVISTEKGEEVRGRPVSWYSTFKVVLDRTEGRKVISLWTDEKTIRSVLDEIEAHADQVFLYGDRRGKGMAPEMLWASRHAKT